jgi:hypothetical protein
LKWELKQAGNKKAARVAGGFRDASEGFLQVERVPSSAVGDGNQK